MTTQVLETAEIPFSEMSIQSVLLDADLFVKYRSPDKAFSLLHESMERSPRSIPLREKMREICISQKNPDEAAKQCLALVSCYINREDFDLAYETACRKQSCPTREFRWRRSGSDTPRAEPTPILRRRATARRKVPQM